MPDAINDVMPRAVREPAGSQGRTRREVVREGLRLAFVAPVVASFLASSAYAANYSCYPQGHVCTGSDNEECCAGLTCQIGTCQP